ncbi:hypothetical protein [Methylorubrum aminovorans]|uniref:hypothetical protein n=1 Tax=Methylorubrum aminovorans TaxID=269069 RepID=UPI003C2F38EC
MKRSLLIFSALLVLPWVLHVEAIALQSGDGSAFDVTVPFSGAQPYNLAERSRDEVNVMAFIPPSIRGAVRAGTNKADLTPYIRAAAATGRTIRFPDGAYRVCNSIPLSNGQRLLGNGVASTRFDIDTCFESTARAVIDVAFGDSSGLDGFEIRFMQPERPDGRDAIIKYPPAVDFSVATRFKIGTLRVSGAWNGLRAVGNAGGFSADLLEIGAYRQGIILDGLLEFAHVNSLHCWPFGLHTDTQREIYYDKTTICAEFGAIDGLDIKSLNAFASSVYSNRNGNSGAARQIGMMQLDGDGARLKNDGGDFQFGMISSTKGVSPDPIPVLWNTSGTITIGSLRLWGASTKSYVINTAGTLVVNGGSFEHIGDSPALQVTGGTAIVTGVRLSPLQGSTRTQPYLLANKGGCLIAKANTVTTAGSGDLVSLESDDACHTVTENDFGTWSYRLPPGAHLGEYGPNKVAAFTWIPKPTFDKANGTFAASKYLVRQGFYSYDRGEIKYSYRVVFQSGPYSGASGNFVLSGLPFTSRSIDQYPGIGGEFSGFNLLGSAAFATPIVSANPNHPGVYYSLGGGPGSSHLGVANVPTAIGLRALSGAGSIPLR